MTRAARAEADVVIVGLGAAGGIAAHALTSMGRSVLAIEAGPSFANGDFVADEIGSCVYDNDLGPKFNREIPVRVRDDGTREPATASPIGLMVNAVGGSSVHFVGWARRFQPENFRALSSTLARYGPGAVAPGCTLTDWPVGYDELEPHYTAVEDLLGVSGLARNVRGAAPRVEGNPFEGERSGEFPLRPLRRFFFGDMFADAARAAGYHPYQPAAAVLSADYDGRPACQYCGWCLGQGCQFGSKSSVAVAAVPKATATGRLEVRTGLRVMRVLMAGDRAVGVVCHDGNGQVSTIAAGTVVLAAYTFENVRLLFLSRCRGHEEGLGNSAKQLGRNFISRQAVEVLGFFPGVSLRLAEGPAAQAMCIDDFNGDNFDHTGLGFIRGGTVAVENETAPIRAAKTVPPWIPRWGREYKEFIVRHWASVGGMRAMPEALPYEGNELDMAWDVPDGNALGLPRLAVRYHMRDNELRLREFLSERMMSLTRAVGAAAVWRGELGFNILSGHDLGGARMGTDPATSVTDPYGRVHDTSNVYALGGTVFPTAPGINPTLTMQALAWRTAWRIAEGD